MTVYTRTDTRRICATGSMNYTAGNVNLNTAALTNIAFDLLATSNASACPTIIITACGYYCASGNCNFTVIIIHAAADAGTAIFSNRCNITASNGNIKIWFVKGDNPLCLFHYDGFTLYASTQEILVQAAKRLRLSKPKSIQQPEEGEILKIDKFGNQTSGSFIPRTSCAHWWRHSPYYGYPWDAVEDDSLHDKLLAAAKAMGVSEDEVQALLDYGCDPDEIEELLYDPAMLHELTGELRYAY